MTPESLPSLPPRNPAGHKGTFGTVAVLGGCARRPTEADPAPPAMLGGPALSAPAALRAGAGLAKLLIPEPLAAAVLTVAPSATALPLPVDRHAHDLDPAACIPILDTAIREASALVVGPGLGVSPGAEAAVLRLVAQDQTPLVIDADALNNLANIPDVGPDLLAPAVLTPHPGEYARLAAALGIDADPTADPIAAAEALAQRLAAIVVLKGAVTIVSDGHRSWTHDRPNPALATAGTGDVLAGVLGSLVAQHVRLTPLGPAPNALTLFDAARLAVAIHADAAHRWTAAAGAPSGMLAADLLDHLPTATNEHRASPGSTA